MQGNEETNRRRPYPHYIMKESLRSIIHAGIRLLRFRLRHATLLMWGILLCPNIYGSPYVWETSVSHLSTEVYEPFCLPSTQTERALDMQPRSSRAESWYSPMDNATTTTIRAQSLFAPTKRASAIRAPFEAIRYRRIGILSSSSSSDYSEEEEAYCYAVFQSNLTTVGATDVAAMAYVTTDASPIQKISRRQASDEWWGDNPDEIKRSNESPVGEPFALLLLALALTFYRQRKHTEP